MALPDIIEAGRVRALREERGWSMRELATRSGVHRNTIGNIEAGKPAHRPTLVALRQAFDAAGAEFRGRTGPADGRGEAAADGASPGDRDRHI